MENNLSKNNVIKNNEFDDYNPNVFYYLVILNTPLNKSIIPLFLKLKPYIVCGDGGSNRFYDALVTKEK